MSDKILIFDFDGTIADTIDLTVEMYNKVAGGYHNRTISKENFAELRSMSLLESIRYMQVPILRHPFIMSKVKAEIHKVIGEARPFDGMKESLRQLKEKGYSLYILSSNSVQNIVKFLEANEIDVFENVHSVESIFGKGSRLKKLIRDHGWDKNSVTYIGDEIRDIQAARKAGVKSVSVTWGYNNRKVLAENKPDMVLNNASEVGDL